MFRQDNLKAAKSGSEREGSQIFKNISKFLDKNITMVTEVSTSFATKIVQKVYKYHINLQVYVQLSDYPANVNEENFSGKDLQASILRCRSFYNDGFNLIRRLASELFVCVIATSDRAYHLEKLSTVPAALRLKPKSFSGEEKLRL